MIAYPNAKVNLGLHVVSKRLDGYHNLETVFLPIPLTDCLEIVEAGSMGFSSSGLVLDCKAEDNLCLRAFAQLQKYLPGVPNAKIHLHKHVPFGAGLGGGSSDAAFVVMLANKLWGLGLSSDEMADIVAPVGADCPFFIYNRPMFAEGIGNEFSVIDINLKGFWILLVKPAVEVTTAQAYKGIVPCVSLNDIRKAVSLPVADWKNVLLNDFEKTVFPIFPQIRKIKESLYDLGADYASMTGSGSAVFGLFSEKPDALDCFEDSFVFASEL